MPQSSSTLMRFDFQSLTDFANPNGMAEAVAEPQPEAKEEPEEKAPPPPPTFSSAELEEAKRIAKEQGHQEGLAEGKNQATQQDSQINEMLATVVRQLGTQLTTMEAGYQKDLKDLTADITALALSIAQKVAGDALDSQPDAPIRQMVEECLPLLLKTPQICLTVHPSIADATRTTLQKLEAEHVYTGQITLETSESLKPTDGRLNWQNGQSICRIDTVWQQIRDRLLANDTGKPLFDAMNAPALPPNPESTAAENTPPASPSSAEDTEN